MITNDTATLRGPAAFIPAHEKSRACALLLSGLNEHSYNRDLFMESLSADLADRAISCLQMDLSWTAGDDIPYDMMICNLTRSIYDALGYLKSEHATMPMVIARGPIGTLLLEMNGVRRILINPTFFHDIRRSGHERHCRTDPEELRSRFTAIALRDMRMNDVHGNAGTPISQRDDLMTLEDIYERFARRAPGALRDKLAVMFPQVVDGDFRVSSRPDAGHYRDFLESPLLQFKLRRHIADMVHEEL